MAPQLALDVNGVRRELSGEFALDKGMGEGAHIYCFFGRIDESAFSESQYFRLSDDMEEQGDYRL